MNCFIIDVVVDMNKFFFLTFKCSKNTDTEKTFFNKSINNSILVHAEYTIYIYIYKYFNIFSIAWINSWNKDFRFVTTENKKIYANYTRDGKKSIFGSAEFGIQSEWHQLHMIFNVLESNAICKFFGFKTGSIEKHPQFNKRLGEQKILL